ncbi:MAG: hypothetical protein R3C56_26800 [Pirellulaceae bacterium]
MWTRSYLPIRDLNTGDVKPPECRKMYSKFRWLAADASATPNYTARLRRGYCQLQTSHIAGMLLTLKLTNYDLAAKMDEHIHARP